MTLTKSNKLGEDIYKKEVFYIDTKSLNDSLYSEVTEFKSSLSRDFSRKIVNDLELLFEDESESKIRTKKGKKSEDIRIGNLLKSNGKLRKPVISFFSDKAKVLCEEIERINSDAEARNKLHCKIEKRIKKDKEELDRLLLEISLYAPGTKHSIDIRRIDLEREALGLGKELRISKISLWRDLVMLRRELREIVFEYQALKRMAELVENGGNNDLAG